MRDETAFLRAELAAIRLLAADAAAAAIVPLKGLTNRVFKIEIPRGAFCLRIPGRGTAEIIDRAAEQRNARAAAKAGVGPEVLHFGADGVMLTPFIEGETLPPARLRTDAGSLQRAAAALRRLHDNASAFAREFHVFDIADRYVRLLDQRGSPLGADQRVLVGDVGAIRPVLQEHPVPLRPCHCDPSGGNLIDDGTKVWLIDWEYSAMNDPMWDLAYLSVEADFDPALDRRLLESYFGRPPLGPEFARLEVFKALCLYLSGLWALVQHTSGNTGIDFSAFADIAFSRCRRLIGNADFAANLAALRNGWDSAPSA